MNEEQSRIAAELGIDPHFAAPTEIARRVQFLVEYARAANAGSLVLGISGGVDSTVAGRICQLAVAQLRSSGMQIRFIAMRLPYGVQADQADAQRALTFIDPDETLVSMAGRLRARQHQGAAAHDRAIRSCGRNGWVGGRNGPPAEAVMGFFTKFGDGGFDLSPLGGLTKRRVRALAAALGGDESLAQKVPTADLESMQPLRPDEEALGVSYDLIDDFLEGKEVDVASADVIVQTFHRTAHKRALPAVPAS